MPGPPDNATRIARTLVARTKPTFENLGGVMTKGAEQYMIQSIAAVLRLQVAVAQSKGVQGD